jgi:membrane-bound lytic murein transglycosylase F
MRELQMAFQDINNPKERLHFALAAYNGGTNHVRDAMALAGKYGGVAQRWADVRRYILLLQEPRYYNDPVVKSGYMRGTETASYVDQIMQRHEQYRRALATGTKVVSAVKTTQPSAGSDGAISPIEATPHRATKKNKWRKE